MLIGKKKSNFLHNVLYGYGTKCLVNKLKNELSYKKHIRICSYAYRYLSHSLDLVVKKDP